MSPGRYSSGTSSSSLLAGGGGAGTSLWMLAEESGDETTGESWDGSWESD